MHKAKSKTSKPLDVTEVLAKMGDAPPVYVEPEPEFTRGTSWFWIQVTGDFRTASYPFQSVKEGGLYPAVHASNQPNWEEKGLVFVQVDDLGNSMMLREGDYTVLSPAGE